VAYKKLKHLKNNMDNFVKVLKCSKNMQPQIRMKHKFAEQGKLMHACRLYPSIIAVSILI
jgi:hypothetical protein